mgnify:CR=1 FL=1
MGEITPKYREINSQNIFAISLAKKINPLQSLIEVPVSNTPLPLGNCYWNSEYYSSKNGGKVKFGWLMLLWPGVCIEAVHHAIWESPEGSLIDVTTHPIGIKAKHSLFLEDNSLVIDIDKTPCIHNHFFTFNNKVKFDEFKNLYSTKISLISEMSEKLWQSGYRCEYQRLSAQGSDDNITLSPKVNACIQLISPLLAKKDEIDILMGKQIKKLNRNS